MPLRRVLASVGPSEVTLQLLPSKKVTAGFGWVAPVYLRLRAGEGSVG